LNLKEIVISSERKINTQTNAPIIRTPEISIEKVIENIINIKDKDTQK
jgi:hypothetical protein